jgi:type I restriction enzyme S subunit
MKRLKFAVRLINEKLEAAASNLSYIGLEDIESGTGRRTSDNSQKVAEGLANRFACGDVLFGKLRPYLAKVLLAEQDGVCSSELLVLRPDEAIESRFLFYYMLSSAFINVVNSSTYGAKMPRASWEYIGNLPVLVPTRDEQRAIAAFLDREMARIDALIAKKQRLIELLEEKGATLISHVVTKGLNPRATMKDSGIRILGQVPAHWDILQYRRVTRRVVVGIAEGSTHAYTNDGVPMIRSTNVRANRVSAEDLLCIERWFADKNSSKYLRAGDLVTVRTGYPGTTAVVPDTLDGCQCFTLLISTLSGSRLPGFYSYYINSSIAGSMLRTEGWGAAQVNISVPILQELVVVDPPIEEQHEIVAYLDRETGKLSALIEVIQNGLEKLHEYRTALISAAVTGKIDVREEAA